MHHKFHDNGIMDIQSCICGCVCDTVLMSNDDAHSSVTTNRWEKLTV